MPIKLDATAAEISGANNVFQTGDFMLKQRASAPPGWIVGMGQTIGNTGSGATITGATVQPLFNLWWTDYSDAQLPILTGAGAASTRGASAAADWAAGKRLTVFDMRGRFARSAGTINGGANVNGTAQGDMIKDHEHNNTAAGYGEQLRANIAAGSDIVVFAGFASSKTSTVLSPNGGGFETRPINIAMLGCYKL